MERNDRSGGSRPPHPGHETRDVHVGVVWLVIALVLAIPLALVLMNWAFDRFAAREAGEQPVPSTLVGRRPDTQPPEPRLQRSPEADLQRMRERDERILSTYGWVDREAGRVRIPVSRAMDVLAERGLPVRAPADAPPSPAGAAAGGTR